MLHSWLNKCHEEPYSIQEPANHIRCSLKRGQGLCFRLPSSNLWLNWRVEVCSGVDAVLDQKPLLTLETLIFPAVSVQFRSRSIEIFGQFNGRRCVDAVGDRRQCVPTEACEDPEDDCGNNFQCGTGNPPMAWYGFLCAFISKKKETCFLTLILPSVDTKKSKYSVWSLLSNFKGCLITSERKKIGMRYTVSFCLSWFWLQADA